MNSFPERHKQQACSRRSLFPRNGFSGQVRRRVLSPRIHAVLSSLACVCVLYCGCRGLLCVICFWKDLHKPLATRINTSQFSIWIQNPEWREMGSRSKNKKGARKKKRQQRDSQYQRRGAFLFPCLSFTGTYARGAHTLRLVFAHEYLKGNFMTPVFAFHLPPVYTHAIRWDHIFPYCMSPLVRSFYLMQPPGRLHQIPP